MISLAFSGVNRGLDILAQRQFDRRGRVLALDSGPAHYPLAALAAPSAAPDFLFGQFTGGRWPPAELRGDRRRLAAAAAS